MYRCYAVQILKSVKISCENSECHRNEIITHIFDDAEMFAICLAETLAKAKTDNFVIKAGEWNRIAGTFQHFIHSELYGDMTLAEDCTAPNFMMFC